jgi:hypothetical protein
MREKPIETLVGGREVEEELSVHSFHWVNGLFLVFRHLLRTRYNENGVVVKHNWKWNIHGKTKSGHVNAYIFFFRQTMHISYKV